EWTDGDYYVIIFADSAGVIEEISESNNIAAQLTAISEQPVLVPGIDLAVLEFDDEVEGNWLWGQSYTVAADVVNLGDTAAGSFTLSIALSADMNFDASDTSVGTHQITSLDAGATSINDVTITLPGTGTDGPYYLVLSVDSEGAVTEADEDNNFDDLDIYIGEGGGPGSDVDLVGDDEPFTLPMDMVWGEQYEVGMDAYNESDMSVGPFTIRMVVSDDANYDASDYELAVMQVSGLGPWEGTWDDEVIITLPAAGLFPDGDYYGIFFVDSDNVIAETNETNNISVYPVHVVTTPNWAAGVELNVFEFEADTDFAEEGQLYWGQYFWADTGIVNLGDTDATAFNIEVFLSDDELIDTSDLELGTIQADGVNSGKMDFFEGDFMLPTVGTMPDGAYYILAQADSDNIFAETDETNNVGSYLVNIIQGSGGPGGDPDLSISNFGYLEMGPFDWNQNITLSADINNYGYGEAGPFDVKVFLSEFTDPHMGGYQLVHQTIQGLPAGGFWGSDWPITLPPMGTMSNGEYNLILVADSENMVFETDEYNNFSVMPIYIGGEQPVEGIDLRGMGPFIPDMIDLVWGQSYQMGADVKNAGDTQAGAFAVSVVLSADDVYDATDEQLAQIHLPGLPPMSEFFNDLQIMLPAPGVYADGSYYIMVVADSGDSVAEADETNNVSMKLVEISETVNLIQGVDLSVMEFSLDMSEGDLVWGRSYMAAADVINMGDTEANAFTITIALSNDQEFGSGDAIIGTVPVYSLGAGQVMINDVMLELPADGYSDGEYFLIMAADSGQAIAEVDETNNVVHMPVYITSDGGGEQGDADLRVNSIMLPPPPLVYNGFLAIQTEIVNDADGSIFEPFAVGLFVSQDVFVDHNDWLVGEAMVYGIMAQETLSIYVDVQFPPEGVFPTNNLYLGAVVDSWNNIIELDEMNNDYVTNLTLETPMVPQGIDLTVMFNQWPGQISENETIEVMYEVHNFGDTAADAFSVEFYLSGDPMVNLDWMNWPTDPGDPNNPGGPGEPLDDDVLLSEVNISSLNPGEMYQETIMLTMPELLDLDFYHLIAVADADAVIEDNFRENNFGVVFVNTMQSGLDLNWHDMFLPFDLQWGQTFTVDALINNWSAQDVMSVDVAFYLSDDYQLDEFDEQLGTLNMTDVFGGSGAQASIELTLPDREGEAMLRIIGKIDPDEILDEFDEYNNIWVRDIYIGMPQLANLMAWPMIMFDPGPGGGSVDWGGAVNVDTGVHNGSDVQTGPFNVSYYLSTNEWMDGVVATLHTEPVPNGLFPFQNYFQTVTLTMPAEDPGGSNGEWYILAEADSDNVVVEFDEMDNVGWAPIFIGSMPADLGGWMEIALDPGVSVQWGQPVPLMGHIENWGGSEAGPFDVSYYLTTDPEIDPSDYLLYTQTVDLLAEQSNTPVPDSLILPADPGQFGSGTVFIVAVIDSGQVIEEIDEWNNFMGDWLTAETAMTELIPFHLKPDWQAFWNQTMQVEVVLKGEESVGYG
ncbi:CARDB domain-containing protein, partial [Planctomycetota bacterium]